MDETETKSETENLVVSTFLIPLSHHHHRFIIHQALENLSPNSEAYKQKYQCKGIEALSLPDGIARAIDLMDKLMVSSWF